MKKEVEAKVVKLEKNGVKVGDNDENAGDGEDEDEDDEYECDVNEVDDETTLIEEEGKGDDLGREEENRYCRVKVTYLSISFVLCMHRW